MSPRQLGKLLVANRGEIALRVIKTAHRMGLGTVAVFSDADRNALHVRAADEAAWIGAPVPAESYLNMSRVLDAAMRTGADAVHPGYGFLSENAEFAERVREAGLAFVGPPASAIRLMGNKRTAKEAMVAAGVPCVPGSDPADQSDAALSAAADRIGYPVMVKAAAGGGGRGMRRVDRAADLAPAVAAARREALAAFGSDELLLEKALGGARHVEVQVFADEWGHCIHLGERDCSVQRRHQKVLEESPSPAVDETLRARMGAAATQAARASGYVGAGTVEFLLDRDGSFYFLEMNTRLQVEHPVTEAVTGLDLVEWQLRIARGEPLPLGQDDVRLSGHCIEARLYAEDPAEGFVPQTGRLISWSVPEIRARVDTGVRQGDDVPRFYDAMLAKVIAHGPTRDAARRRLMATLQHSTVFGVWTNRDLLLELLADSRFAEGHATTEFIPAHFPDAVLRDQALPDSDAVARAALIVYLESGRRHAEDDSLVGWRSGGPVWATLGLRSRGVTTAVQIETSSRGRLGRCYAVRSAPPDVLGIPATASSTPRLPEPLSIEVLACGEGQLIISDENVRRVIRYALEAGSIWTDDGRRIHAFEDVTHRPREVQDVAADGMLRAPLDGSVAALNVQAGDRVEAGQVLAVVEAMKMEHPIQSALAGTVRRVAIAVGTQVKARQILIELERDEEPA